MRVVGPWSLPLATLLALVAPACDTPQTERPGDAGAAAAKIDEGEARRSAWLRATLTGRDNPMAAVRSASITQEGAAYKLFIQNQMAMTCGLVFGADGRPAELVARPGVTTACAGPEGWRSREPNIKLDCSEADGKETCQGKYRLSSPQGFADAAVLEIFRPLDSPAARTAERPASESACQGLRCRGQAEGTTACVQVSDKPGDHVLCVCRAGVPTSSGRCPPGASCQDANDGKASCRAK